MINVFLNKINIYNEEDQKFLYDILLFRWKNKDIINIKYKVSEKLPTFQEHVDLLKSGKYKVFYKIIANDIPIGTVFIDKNDVNGTFIIPSLLRKVFKKYKGCTMNIEGMPLSSYIHKQLFALHPEIEIHYASVNPKNKLSLNNLIDNGYEFIECILAMKTINGKATTGKWSEI